ncbi:MAG: hypothetical protein IGS38_10740 [Synechococcales cyanobacterium M58_A2018_015]|nr:hypothetical protein [Synechococcales cyanobacterium M58_A2018_015]
MDFGPGFLPTFLYYFTSTAVICAFVVSRALGVGLDSSIPQEIGAAGGVVAGLLGAYFNRTVTYTVSVPSQKKFLNYLETLLEQMGYRRAVAESDETESESATAAESTDLRVYERSSFSKWFSGKIYVQLDAKSVTIASRAVTIRQLRRQLAASNERKSP